MLSLEAYRVRAKAVAVASVVVAASLGAVQNAMAQDLTGAGSTFINPIMQQWIADYAKATGVQVNYQSIGSGGGISALLNHTVDFAGSDAPMNAQELQKAGKPVLHIPVVIGTVCVSYNVPGIYSGMKLTGPIVSDIFLGRIQYWDDKQIVKLNGNLKLPHERIFVAHRSDGSGTTYIFTDYLAKVSPAWKSAVGSGKSVHWPVGLGGKGNEGVAGLLKSHPYSIGYCELAYADQNDIARAHIRNAKGNFVKPDSDTGSLAAAGVTMPADMRVSITNTSNPGGYPITGFSWLIVYKDSNKATELKKFLNWLISDGQSYTTKLRYGPVPAAVQSRLKAMVNSIS